jgi:nucleoside-diphosphate-sugar epimerase
MKVLCTGCAGYVGSILTGLLLDNGYQVVGLDNLQFGGQGLLRHFRNKNFEFIKGDVRNDGAVIGAAVGCDVAIHLAAIVGYPACSNNVRLAKEVNHLGTRSVRTAMHRRPIIFASTQSVYGKVKMNFWTGGMQLSSVSQPPSVSVRECV